MRYDAIFQWNMSASEAAAYKLAVLYEEEFHKICKDGGIDGGTYRRNTIPKRGDPRKSNLFRHCWKLRRETRGLLQPEQYRLYIQANLTIIKLNNGRIEPNAICGDKAWIRWKVYERWYNNKLADINHATPPPSATGVNPKIIREIDKTKKFLFEKCDGEPTVEKITSFVENGIMKLWVMTGKVSKYYVVLSPFVRSCCKIDPYCESCGFDAMLIQEKTTQEVREYFNYEYRHEFGSPSGLAV